VDRRSEAKTSRTAKAVAAASDDALCTLLSAGLRVQAGEDRWRVIGNTLVYRLLLREAGGIWNRLDQCWEFAGDDPTTRLASALEGQPAGAGHNADAAEPQPHYHGHRGRVRERVMRAGAELLEDYELLELLLFYSIERIDTKPLAKRLLDRFGTLGDVFAAEPAELREFEVDQRTLVLFKASREAGRRLAERKVKDMPVLTNWQQLIDYCHTALAHEKTEQFRILFLDRKNVLIADEVQQRGTIDHTPVYPREVVKRALALNAAALILVHNQPTRPFQSHARSRSIPLKIHATFGLRDRSGPEHVGDGIRGDPERNRPQSTTPWIPLPTPLVTTERSQCQALVTVRFDRRSSASSGPGGKRIWPTAKGAAQDA
jgi:DNA repair protein RadC